ncbi:AbgT family transporter [Wenzhouxiangella marina]|uniref:Aminobenzoyl-glutamate transporter n=1 Tax=Wenzhouxiangella marina TaxID=1579979 RepID=A0A0K0XWH5_9GAMM|nr:AbgT family transporter [Wenzhouxiangella marina]AKS41966.1 aminobenzoyl-glutamate transporter [Wenzhouxiangella marina]MBB6086267.1 aminobenzoyl-glutamate transport protein [Wenzhouxiangella marina]
MENNNSNASTSSQNSSPDNKQRSFLERSLNVIEVVGNKLPDPAVLFFLLMIAVWIASAFLAQFTFTAVHPSTGEPINVINQLSGDQLANFMVNMVSVFVNFAPLGIVLVALLGVGVAEHTGFVNAALRKLLGWTSASLLTPMLILVAIVSHTAADAGYVVVIPLGAVIFYAAGRHPLAGIAAAFAGVSGGFSANFIPSAIDPMLAGITEAAGQVLDPELYVNPLANWFFMSASSLLIIGIGWWLTDKVIEPRLVKDTPIDGDMSDMPTLEPLSREESRGLSWATFSIVLSFALLAAAVLWPGSPLRDPNPDLTLFESITSFGAPVMRSIVPLIFILFLIPGVVYGYAARTIESHKDIITGMSKAMESMGYYIVMAFFAAQFIAAFNSSNIGILIAVNGAGWLGSLGLPAQVTIVGIIGLTMFVNLFVGSASAKWLIIAPIFVPMLMQLGISPELAQAAYRVGDSSSNIITPLLPYFPLIVVFCKRYFKGAGIGTLISMMLPYSIMLAVGWTIFLLIYWALGIPLGLQAGYTYG